MRGAVLIVSTGLLAGCSGIPLAVKVDNTCTIQPLETPAELKAWFRAQYDDEGRPLPTTPTSLKPWLDRIGDDQEVLKTNC